MDAAVALAIEGFRTDTLDTFFRSITHLGDVVTLALIVAVIALVLIVRGRRTEAIVLAVATPAGGLLNYSVKLLIDRGRPDAAGALIALPESPGMPSGHAFGAAVLAVLVLWVLPRDRKSRSIAFVVAVVITALVGMSRVYLGVHWASDVFVGLVFGSLWGWIVSMTGDRLMSREAT